MNETPPPKPASGDDTRRRRLRFRAEHRGTKECDLLIGGFVARHLAEFTEAELTELETLLEWPDPVLADWLTGRRPIPDDLGLPIIHRLFAAARA